MGQTAEEQRILWQFSFYTEKMGQLTKLNENDNLSQ